MSGAHLKGGGSGGRSAPGRMRIAFLGLGRMGAPMARRLVDAGHEVVVWNRTAAKTEGFEDVAETPADCVSGAELVITMLADPNAVREVVFASGMAKALRMDAVYVDMSTIGVPAARRVHEAVERATLDAPVGGGVSQAGAGELTVLVGGDTATLDRVRDSLATLGEVVWCGQAASGQAMKLVFNSVLATTIAGIGEAVVLGERLGLETTRVLEVLERGGAGPMVARKAERIAEADYPASFALTLMCKDIALAREAGRDASAWQPALTLASELFERARGEGLADDDYSAITELFRRSDMG